MTYCPWYAAHRLLQLAMVCAANWQSVIKVQVNNIKIRSIKTGFLIGGATGIRTPDPLLAKQVL
jgi:hypothetical protein